MTKERPIEDFKVLVFYKHGGWTTANFNLPFGKNTPAYGIDTRKLVDPEIQDKDFAIVIDTKNQRVGMVDFGYLRTNKHYIRMGAGGNQAALFPVEKFIQLPPGLEDYFLRKNIQLQLGEGVKGAVLLPPGKRQESPSSIQSS